MNIQAEKSEIIERFKQINDSSLINAIKNLLDYAQKDRTINQDLKEKLSNRALISEQNIKEEKILSLEEVKDKATQLLG